MQSFSKWFKVLFLKQISSLVLAAFITVCCHDFSYAVSANMVQLSVQTNLTKSIETFQGKKDAKLYIIPTIHCHPNTQTSIKQIIEKLKAKHGDTLQTIGIEGSVGEIKLDSLQNIKSEVVRRKVLEFLATKGELFGAEVYAAINPGSVKVYGLEDKDVYMQNFRQLYKSLTYKDEIQKLFEKINKMVRRGKTVLYTDSLRKFEDVREDYQNGNLDTNTFIEELVRYVSHSSVSFRAEKRSFEVRNLKTVSDQSEPNDKISQSLTLLRNDTQFAKKYPNIDKVRKMGELSRQIRQREVQLQMGVLLRRLIPYLTDEEKAELGSKQGEDYYGYIEQLLKSKNIHYRGYPMLNTYMKYLKYKAEVNHEALLSGLNELEYEIAKSLGRGKHPKNLIFMDHNTKLLNDYLNNSVSIASREKWETVHDEYYRTTKLMSSKLTHNDMFTDIENDLKEAERNMREFYKTANKRNEIMVMQILGHLRMTNDELLMTNERKKKAYGLQLTAYSSIAVMIIGGYHTRGVTDILRTKGISYEVIMPKVEGEYDRGIYEARLKEQYEYCQNHRLKRLHRLHGFKKKKAYCLQPKAYSQLELASRYGIGALDGFLKSISNVETQYGSIRDVQIQDTNQGFEIEYELDCGIKIVHAYEKKNGIYEKIEMPKPGFLGWSMQGKALINLIQNLYRTFNPHKQSVELFMQELGNKLEESIKKKPEIKDAADMFRTFASKYGLSFRVQKLKVAYATVAYATIEGDEQWARNKEKQTFVVSRRLLRMMAILDKLAGKEFTWNVANGIGERALIGQGKSIEEADRIMKAKNLELKLFEQEILPLIEKLHTLAKGIVNGGICASDLSTKYLQVPHSKEPKEAKEYKKLLQKKFDQYFDIVVPDKTIWSAFRNNYWFDKYKTDEEHQKVLLREKSKELALEHATTYKCLALMFLEKSDLDSAIEYTKDVLRIMSKQLGVSHLDIAKIYDSLGIAYFAKGDLDSAIRFYNKALEIRSITLEAKHPMVVKNQRDLDCVNKARGNWKVFGDKGNMYLVEGNYNYAILFYIKALEMGEIKVQEYDLSFAQIYEKLGDAYFAKHNYDRAIKSYYRVSKIKEQKIEKNSSSLARIYEKLGNAYLTKGEYDDAIGSYNIVLQIKQKKLGENDISLLKIYDNLGKAYSANGNNDDTIKVYNKTLGIRQSKLAKNHPDVVSNYENLQKAYKAKADNELAKKCADEVRKRKERRTTFRVGINNIPVLERLKRATYSQTPEGLRQIQQDIDSVKNVESVRRRSGDTNKGLLAQPAFRKLRKRLSTTSLQEEVIRIWEHGAYEYEEIKRADGMIFLKKYEKKSGMANLLPEKQEPIDIQILEAPVIDIEILEAALGTNPIVRAMRKACKQLGKSMEFVREVYLPFMTTAASLGGLRAIMRQYEAVEKDLEWADVQNVRRVERAA
ncbi:tetratricopeptide repeat protein [bacterium]